MKDPISALRKAIVDYLQYDVKVYDTFIDPNEKNPCFVISTISAEPISTKGNCYNGWSCTVTLTVYNNFGQRGGNLETDLLSQNVLLMMQDENFLLSDFQVNSLELINTSTSGVNLLNRTLFRRDFQLNFQIVES
jgi:hypothetical protein